MKISYIFFFFVLLSACNNQADKASGPPVDSPHAGQVATGTTEPIPVSEDASDKTYSNVRFRNVTVNKRSDSLINVRGEGQIFEASFGWLIKEDEVEVQKGFESTDAGAPAWGKFDFTIKLNPPQPGSKRRLVLYETSAEDGSRQHILEIPFDN